MQSLHGLKSTASLRDSISVMWRADGHVTCHVIYGTCNACTVTRDDPLVDPNLAACAAGDSAARRSAMPTATDASPAACAAGDSAARCSAMPTATDVTTEHPRVSQASANHVLRSTARILSTTTLSTTTGIWSFQPGPGHTIICKRICCSRFHARGKTPIHSRDI